MMNYVQNLCEVLTMNRRVTTRDAILQQTMAIAMKEGIDKVSIRKIASECNIAIGSVYNYFPNKDALVEAVCEQFWERILDSQEQIYTCGMGFCAFLEYYYSFLYGRLVSYDRSWLSEMRTLAPHKSAVLLLKQALVEDTRVNQWIWNMELNEDAFCEYVLTNLMALLRSGENNCRFFLFLLEHLLYNE